MIILFMDVYKSGSTDGLGFVFWRVCLVSFWREQTIWTIFGNKYSIQMTILGHTDGHLNLYPY